MKSDRYIIAAVFAGIAVAAALVANHNRAESRPVKAAVEQRAVVRVSAPEVAAASSDFRLPARTAPVEQALIFARATGVVSERRVDIGSRVRRGDVLAVVTAPEIDQGVDRARAALAQAKAKEQLAQTNLTRSHQLVDQGFLSRQVLDERVGTYDAAVADRLAAEAELRRFNEIKGFQVVRAPFAGVIAERRVDRGDRVVGDSSNAEGYLFRIVRTEELRVAIDVPQSVAMQVQAGMTAEVVFPELPGERLAAKVVRSSGVIDSRSGTMQVELALPNPTGRIPAGMLGEVVLKLMRQQPVLLVPNSAVFVRDGKPQVATVQGANAQSLGTVRFLPVHVGRNLGNRVEVLAGLSPDAALVTNPNALLRDGDAVQVETAPPPAAKKP
jgi:multidrug efflux system membrane fusion protein